MQPFAIITFRDTGPIKNWSDMRGAQIHNARTKPIDHGVEGAPVPEHLIGTGDLIADVKARLVVAKIDPNRLRKNGVIAYEAIMTASPDFFDQGSASEKRMRLAEWKQAQVEFAVARWGRHRVASMVLHLDEKTPHIHIIVVPLEVKSDKRRTDRSVRWGLVGRSISGPGQFDRLQDDYACAMEPFGLRRGIRGSGQKKEPMAAFMERTAEAKRQADNERRAAEAHRAAAITRERELLEAMDICAAERGALEVERRKLRAERAKVAEEALAVATARQEYDAARRSIEDALAAAQRFRDAVGRVPMKSMHPAAPQALNAANRLQIEAHRQPISPQQAQIGL